MFALDFNDLAKIARSVRGMRIRVKEVVWLKIKWR